MVERHFSNRLLHCCPVAQTLLSSVGRRRCWILALVPSWLQARSSEPPVQASTRIRHGVPFTPCKDAKSCCSTTKNTSSRQKSLATWEGTLQEASSTSHTWALCAKCRHLGSRHRHLAKPWRLRYAQHKYGQRRDRVPTEPEHWLTEPVLIGFDHHLTIICSSRSHSSSIKKT